MDAFEKLPPEKQEAILQSGITEFSNKTFADANTDAVTQRAGISKGLLFHYFGSKKAFYLVCLRAALGRLTAKTPEPEQNDFFSILFFVMDEKLRLCRDFPAETLLVNMAARDASAEIAREKLDLFAHYLSVTTKASQEVLSRAIATLPLKQPENPKLLDAVSLYVNAINQRFLTAYRETPLAFFENAEQIKLELKEYLSFLLEGIVKQEV